MREDVEMSFGDHLDELRRRVIYAVVGLMAAAIFCGVNYEFLLSALIRPYKQAYEKMIARKLGKPKQPPDQAEEGEGVGVPDDSPLAPALKAIEKRLLDLKRRLDAIAPEKETGPEASEEDVAYAERFPSPRIIQPSPLTGYVTIILLCVICGIILGSPWILYQIWAFVGVGLYPNERRFIYLYGPFSFFLFIGGAATFYFFLLPVGLEALMGPTAGVLVDNMPMVEPSFLLNEYFKFVALLTLVFGIVFQTPLVVMFIAWTEIVPIKTLFKQQRVVLLILCVLAAMFTPPDPVTMGLMAVPMVLLYQLGLLLAWITLRKKRRRRTEEEEDWWGGDDEGGSLPTAPTGGGPGDEGAAAPPGDDETPPPGADEGATTGDDEELTEESPGTDLTPPDETGEEETYPDDDLYEYEREYGQYEDEDLDGYGEEDYEETDYAEEGWEEDRPPDDAQTPGDDQGAAEEPPGTPDNEASPDEDPEAGLPPEDRMK